MIRGKNILSAEERSRLLVQHKRERDGKLRDRIKVVLLFDDGWTPTAIARALFIDDETVNRQLEIYGTESRLTSNHKGQKPLLTDEDSQALEAHLESLVYVKVKDIQAYVKATFNKQLAVSTLTLWLKNHKFSYKKPKLVPKNAAPIKQAVFIEAYKKLMIEAAVEGDPVVFGDGVHPTQQVRPSYGWMRRGQDTVIETTGARKRINVLGAFNVETTQFDYDTYETINAAAAISFLKTLEQAYPKARKIHCILDQAGYFTAKEVVAFLDTSRVKVLHLPPRSPNLNPIERLWKIMHEYVSNNRTHDTFKKYKESLFIFFDKTIPAIRDELVSRITDNFQPLILAK